MGDRGTFEQRVVLVACGCQRAAVQAGRCCGAQDLPQQRTSCLVLHCLLLLSELCNSIQYLHRHAALAVAVDCAHV